MRTPRIYYPDHLSPDLTVTLDEPTANHLVRVLRLHPGAPIVLFNGRGGEFHGVLTAAARRAVTVRLSHHVPREVESPLHITLGQCIVRGTRMDLIVQKAVELGVSAIVPVISERCEVRLRGERQENRLQHWEGICINACEQCGRNRLPKVQPPQAIDAWLNQAEKTATDETLGIVLDAAAQPDLTAIPRPGHGARITVLSGPEGGLTDGELALAVHCGLVAVNLGPRILRAETAPLSAIAALQTLWGDFCDSGTKKTGRDAG
jgi:16S rRNA (uracil1498-N3)-methyltransferase